VVTAQAGHAPGLSSIIALSSALNRFTRSFNLTLPAPTAALAAAPTAPPTAVFRIRVVDEAGIRRFILGNLFTITP
jgi:hypothetical protein